MWVPGAAAVGLEGSELGGVEGGGVEPWPVENMQLQKKYCPDKNNFMSGHSSNGMISY